MGYTSERTTINKSLESLNQETQRVQKQTNYEFDRLNQRRRDNMAANAQWIGQNEAKLEMGLESFNELMTANEPEGGYKEDMYGVMSELRDKFYKTLQNRDAEGNDINPKDAQIERDQLMKEVVRASEDRGADAGLGDKVNAAGAIQKGKPGSISGATDPNTLGLFKPGTKKIPKVVDGRIVYEVFNPIIDEETGEPVKNEQNEYTYAEEPNQVRKSGELTRGVQDGSIGIVTEGDSTTSRDALQTEKYDRYAEDLTKLIDKTDLNNQTISQDATEMIQRFEKDISTMDITDIISDNAGMQKNWTNLVDKVTTLATSTDLYKEDDNPFANMLIEAAPGLDKDGSGIIEKDEMTPEAMNSVLGAWNPNDPKIKKLAEDYYHTYDPTSGILPTYVNDMITQQRLLGGDQLTANQKRMQDRDNKKISNAGTSNSSDSSNSSNSSNSGNSKTAKPAGPANAGKTFPTNVEVVEGETFSFDEPIETENGNFTFTPMNNSQFVRVKTPDGKVEVINTGGPVSAAQLASIEKQLAGKATFHEKDRLTEINNLKKKSEVDNNADTEKEKPNVGQVGPNGRPLDKNGNEIALEEDQLIKDLATIKEERFGKDGGEEAEEVVAEEVETNDGEEKEDVSSRFVVDSSGGIKPSDGSDKNSTSSLIFNIMNDEATIGASGGGGVDNFGFTGTSSATNKKGLWLKENGFDKYLSEFSKEKYPKLNDNQRKALAAEKTINDYIIGGEGKVIGGGNSTIINDLSISRDDFEKLAPSVRKTLIDYKLNSGRSSKDLIAVALGIETGVDAYLDNKTGEVNSYNYQDLERPGVASRLTPQKLEAARDDMYLGPIKVISETLVTNPSGNAKIGNKTLSYADRVEAADSKWTSWITSQGKRGGNTGNSGSYGVLADLKKKPSLSAKASNFQKVIKNNKLPTVSEFDSIYKSSIEGDIIINDKGELITV